MIRSLTAAFVIALFLASSLLAQPQATAGKPRLGVRLQPAEDEGVLIIEVMYGYAAETSGLKAGDVIVRVGEDEITDPESFRDAVGRMADGQALPFTVMRGEQEQVIQVTMNPPRADAPGSKPPTKPELRTELLAMMEKDQAERRRLMEEPDLPEDERQKLIEQMQQHDEANRARLKQIIGEHGFPTISMVGQDGASAVFLMIQHGDRDPQWQASLLPVIEELSKKGEASKSSVAYLTDRVLRAQGKPQLYGTQYYQEAGPDGTPVYVAPVVEDPKNLDQRRMEMGLGPWAAYEAQMAKMQQREPFEAPRGPGEK